MADGGGRVVQNMDSYENFVANIDFRRTQRHQWMAAATGKNRSGLQIYLLGIARSATSSSVEEQIAIYKGAYAVLPLHGNALAQFVELLIETQMIGLEWCDVLLAALLENATVRRQTIYVALKRELSDRPDPTALQSRWRVLVEQAAAIWDAPAWLTKLRSTIVVETAEVKSGSNEMVEGLAYTPADEEKS